MFARGIFDTLILAACCELELSWRLGTGVGVRDVEDFSFSDIVSSRNVSQYKVSYLLGGDITRIQILGNGQKRCCKEYNWNDLAKRPVAITLRIEDEGSKKLEDAHRKLERSQNTCRMPIVSVR